MKITQTLIDELRTQAKKQSQRNYKWLEIDARTLLALLAEIERSRLVELRFEVPKHAQLRD